MGAYCASHFSVSKFRVFLLQTPTLQQSDTLKLPFFFFQGFIHFIYISFTTEILLPFWWGNRNSGNQEISRKEKKFKLCIDWLSDLSLTQ
jgi:hypothetical protein